MTKIILISLILYLQISAQPKDTSIIFSEVMFYNSSSVPNGEFIELFNTSYNDTFDIGGWKIKYYTSSPDQIIDVGFGTKILPRQFAVIFENDYAGGYSVPSNALILKISDNSFGTSGMANTTDRDIHLLNASSNTIWSYTYSANNSSGYSDEKIVLIGENALQNWGNSTQLNGTPGAFNSISQRGFDLGLIRFIINPLFPVLKERVEISAWVKNYGLNNAENFSVTFSFDFNNDGYIEIVSSSSTINSLSSGDSVLVKADSLIEELTNSVKVDAKINFSLDENELNDTLSVIIKPGVSSGSILISEVMFDPRAGEPEWIEIYNKTDKSINLKGWKISDVLSTPTIVTITNNDFYFEPKSVLVLASSFSISNFYDSIPGTILLVPVPNLNNDKDGIVIYDERGLTIDSLFYFSDWGTSKKSIERISYELPSNLRNNWVASISDSGGTPGKLNSVMNIQPGILNSIIINEIMYDPLTGNSEFIEIYNSSNDSINIAGWKIIEGGGKIFNLAPRSFYLKSGNYLLLTSDSSVFNLFGYLKESDFLKFIKITNTSDLSLSNSEDVVILKDIFGNVIDSVFYRADWHNPEIDDVKGRSLERINPGLNSNDRRNWTTSVNPNGGTPLKQNSVFTKNLPLQSTLNIDPNPFSPDNDGFEDFTIIKYQLPLETSQIRIRIFDSVGRLVRTLVDNEPSGSTGSIIFDGLDDNKQRLRIGIYIILLEAINQQNGVIEQVKKALVVAKKLR